MTLYEKRHGGAGQKLAITIGLVISILLMMAVKIYIQNNKTFNQAERAFETQDRERAIRFYERTIRWYLPFNGHINSAIKRLWQIGEQAETSKELDLAKTTYARLRSSLYAIQSFYQPYKGWIAKCNIKLKDLSNPDTRNLMIDESPEPSGRIKSILPHAGWALLAQIGFWGWIASTMVLIWQGRWNDVVGRMDDTPMRIRWLSIITGFYLLWAISLIRA